MFRKHVLIIALMASIALTMMFVGVTLSTVGPSISVYPSTGVTADSDIRITGKGWADSKLPLNTPVFLYLDEVSTNQLFAVVNTSTFGTFSLYGVKIESLSFGSHKVIAFQNGGAIRATADFTVSVTTPLDDRNSNIGRVECWGNSTLQTQNGTILEKEYYEYFVGLVPRKIDITVQVDSLSAGENVTIFRYIGGYTSERLDPAFNIVITTNGFYTYSFEATKWGITVQCTNGFSLDYDVVVTYQPPAP